MSFVDVSKADANFGNDLTRQQAMDRFHVRLPDGKLVSGARGFTLLWDTLPKWRWLARLTRMPGITPMAELAYRVFLPLRPVLSRIASWFGAKPVNQIDTQMGAQSWIADRALRSPKVCYADRGAVGCRKNLQLV
nr:DCC1-like thiol-disulfide oxidoreductase family protein [Ruegeria arenilitoris]